MSPTPRHHWIRAPRRSDRARLIATIDVPTTLTATVDAHRRLRGPYTAAGILMDAIVPEMLDSAPELIRAHDIEVLSASPNLRGTVPATHETLTSLAVPAERTRFYSRLRTLRIANGLCELLRDHLSGKAEPRSLVIENVQFADQTDAEWLTVLLRRMDPRILTLVICTEAEPASTALAEALSLCCESMTGTGDEPVTSGGLASDFVDSDGTTDDPATILAYQRLRPEERAALHDERAAELEATAPWSARLGAIPYHRERGADPAGLGAGALRVAVDYCIDMGFYHAALDLGERGRAVIDRETQLDHWWAFTTKMTTSLAALGRGEEAEVFYDEVRATRTEGVYHMQAAYATAMLYTRHFSADRIDHLQAKRWINQAIAFAHLMPKTRRYAMEIVFQQNGLALIETHLKSPFESLRLVTEGLERLDRELNPDEHRLHRSVLRHNRAQVLAGLGRLDEALADYSAVIDVDPNYAEYYLDRGNVLRRLGRDEEALADYERAIQLSPPFPEVYYNRADVLLAAGDIEAGMAGLDYVIEIDPTFVDAYVNRAGLHVQLGEYDAASRDVAAGLALDPENAHLYCVRGQLLAEKGEFAAAIAAYDTAIARDDTLQAAWAGRAIIAFDQGELTTAIADLTRALELGDDPALRYNRATAYQAADRRADAVDDLKRALELAPDDPDSLELLEQLNAL